jgi:hemoglobin
VRWVVRGDAGSVIPVAAEEQVFGASQSAAEAHRWRLVKYDAEKVQTVYEAAGGYDGLLRLARAWHTRVIADEVVSHAFSHGFHPDHSERLAAYWAEALGGPTTFSTAYGDETSVVRMHSGHGPHEEMDRRAIACFDQALTDVGMASGDGVRKALHDYFAWATTTTMSRYHRSSDDVPDGLQIPRWSWDGLVAGTGTDDI